MDEPAIMNMKDNINVITYEWQGRQLTTYGEWDGNVVHLWLDVEPDEKLYARARIMKDKDLKDYIWETSKEFYGEVDLYVPLPTDDYYYFMWVE